VRDPLMAERDEVLGGGHAPDQFVAPMVDTSSAGTPAGSITDAARSRPVTDCAGM
jgi:hypothetical protein